MQKFRVYDKVGKHYIDDDQLEYFFVGSNGKLFWQEYDESICLGLEELSSKRYLVEYLRYEKDGVEYYDGDIAEIKLPDTPFDEGEIFEGIFDCDKDIGRVVICDGDQGVYYLHDDIKVGKIVGTIHDNEEK